MLGEMQRNIKIQFETVSKERARHLEDPVALIKCQINVMTRIGLV